MFHDVLLVVHDVLQVVHDVLRCITMFYKCFMMFNNVSRYLVSRPTIGTADHNSAEIGDDAAGIVNIAAKVIPC